MTGKGDHGIRKKKILADSTHLAFNIDVICNYMFNVIIIWYYFTLFISILFYLCWPVRAEMKIYIKRDIVF